MVDERTTNIAIIISAVTGTLLLLFRIPEGIAQWSPYFDALLTSISPTVLNWIQNFLIAGFSFIAGWYLKSIRTNIPSEITIDQEHSESETEATEEYDSSLQIGSNSVDSTDSIDTIEGCIKVGETCWRGTATLTEDGGVSDTTLEYKAICPNCQTVMYDGENTSVAVATTATTYWDCPSCGHTTVEDYGKYQDAQNLFQSHIQRIVEREGEEYSLENLIETTPREVWEEYAEVVDDPQVSLNCFH